MSRTTATAAIERIRTDPTFARAVAARGAPALSPFELDDAEQVAIVDALRRDLAEATDEVAGFGFDSAPKLRMPNLLSLDLGGGSHPTTPDTWRSGQASFTFQKINFHFDGGQGSSDDWT